MRVRFLVPCFAPARRLVGQHRLREDAQDGQHNASLPFVPLCEKAQLEGKIITSNRQVQANFQAPGWPLVGDKHKTRNAIIATAASSALGFFWDLDLRVKVLLPPPLYSTPVETKTSLNLHSRPRCWENVF